jgi:hypothetical protein
LADHAVREESAEDHRAAHGTPGGPAEIAGIDIDSPLGTSSVADTASWCSFYSPLVAEELKPLS